MKAKKVLVVLLLGCMAACQQQKSKTVNSGVVSSASPEASQAGYEILQKGGNAADAAIAVSFALGVTEPAMSGLGGGTQVLLALPGQPPIAINGTTFSPALTPVGATKKDLTYHRRSTIPSTVKVLGYILREYGSGNLEWEQLLEPAIRYAQEGFTVSKFLQAVYKKNEKKVIESPYNTHFFLINGRIPDLGDTLKQPVLAQTLQRLAREGPDDFYNGEIAEMIASDMKSSGGWITLEDLRNFPDPVELPALSTTYRGFEVYSQPPPCGGWTALLALNILENFPPNELMYGTQSRFNDILLALHLAHEDRKDNPVIDLLNYQDEVDKKLSKAYALWLLEQNSNKLDLAHENDDSKAGETTHFSIVDGDGMVMAVTASINAYFGAGAASEELGFLYNTYMNDYEIGIPDHPFAIGPGLMNYSSMSPTIVQKDGESVLALGSPGSARIISTVVQLTQLWVDSGASIKDIIGYYRFHSLNNKIYYEDPAIPSSWSEAFLDNGFEVEHPAHDLEQNGLNAYFGGVHAVAKENGLWVGASDPRRDGNVFQ